MRRGFRVLFSLKMLCMVALGFASGVPFLITKDILKAWMTDEQVDIAVIGLFSAVSLPYTGKFLWAPFMDRFTLPFLGRRRGWIITVQIALLLAIALLGQFNPHNTLLLLALMALVIAFLSASQDIVLDAFRREYLTEEELGLGTGIWVNAYRFANLATVGLAFALADKIGYAHVHFLLAGMMGMGIIAILWAPEPPLHSAPPASMKEAILEPFIEFFRREGALAILAFILLYKIGDNMAAAMNVPFVLQLGFEKTEYFLIVKGVGMSALFLGMFLGGLLMVQLGIARSLWVFGVLQMVSTAGFVLLSYVGKNHLLLTIVVTFELLSTGLGTTAYTTFMAAQTHQKFTATQYALLTSIMAIPGAMVASITGYLVKGVGWSSFYWICCLAALPGLLFLVKIAPWRSQIHFPTTPSIHHPQKE